MNELIDLVQQRPLDRDSTAELLFAPPGDASQRRQVAGTPAPTGLFAVELPTPAKARAVARRGTTEVPAFAKRLLVPAGILVMVGLGVGAAVSLTRGREIGTSIDYVAAFTPPKVVIAPKPAPAPPKPAFVDVMLASTPPGATATLLDNTTGASTPLGSTPVEASLNPTKQYDVRFELDGHRATTQHLDPTTSTKLEVALAEPEPEPVAKHHHHHAAAKNAAQKRVATAPSARRGSDGETALAALAPTKKDGKPSDAPGTLAITTSVPCAILVDGANTGKTSPAKLSVPAGHHSVRLIAATQHINKQIGVDVTAKKTTRVDQTF